MEFIAAGYLLDFLGQLYIGFNEVLGSIIESCQFGILHQFLNCSSADAGYHHLGFI